MNYKIVTDYSLLCKFVWDFLPELQTDQTFYVMLMARRKYLEDKTLLKSDAASLKRFLCNKKEHIIDKLYQLETTIGNYTLGNAVVPQEALACYIMPNPRSHKEAAKNLLIELAKKISNDYDGYNVRSLAMTAYQQAKGDTHFMDFDFDIEEKNVPQTIEKLKNYVNSDALSILKTFGGMHALVNVKRVEKQYEKTFYKQITQIQGCDVRGSATLIPIPGCVQSTYTPYMIYTI